VGQFIDFAVATGRKIIGITDHWGRYLGLSQKPLRHYPGTISGYRQFAGEVAEAAERHSDTVVLFGPEAGFEHLTDGGIAAAFELPEVTYFIAECGGMQSGVRYGQYLVDGIRAAASARDTYKRPGFLAHPLRAAINTCVGKTGPGPQMPKQPPLRPLGLCDDTHRHVELLFDIDIHALAEASRRYDIPIEINRSSWRRMIGMNQEPFVERYIYFYRALIESGASVVLGSDLHGVEDVAPTPFIAARWIGVEPRDMTFLRYWLGPIPEALSTR